MSKDDAQADDEPQIIDVTITAPDADWLREHCAMLIEKRLAASANIVPSVDSIYRWEGEIQYATEAYATIHTSMSCFERIAELTKERHPYAVSHILAKAIVAGSYDYVGWIQSSASGST